MSDLTEEQKAERKQLFLAYDVMNEAVQTAEAQVEEAKLGRSKAVATINEKFGGGPYLVKGELLRIAKRNDTFFFRGVKVEGDVV